MPPNLFPFDDKAWLAIGSDSILKALSWHERRRPQDSDPFLGRLSSGLEQRRALTLYEMSLLSPSPGTFAKPSAPSEFSSVLLSLDTSAHTSKAAHGIFGMYLWPAWDFS